MTQIIDQAKLKAAAERLEWVLRQYPGNKDVQALLGGLLPLIEDAKAGRVREPVERIPFEYNFADGMYVPFKDPSVGGAYADFATQMRGGVTEQEEQLLARMRAYRQTIDTGRARVGRMIPTIPTIPTMRCWRNFAAACGNWIARLQSPGTSTASA